MTAPQWVLQNFFSKLQSSKVNKTKKKGKVHKNLQNQTLSTNVHCQEFTHVFWSISTLVHISTVRKDYLTYNVKTKCYIPDLVQGFSEVNVMFNLFFFINYWHHIHKIILMRHKNMKFPNESYYNMKYMFCNSWQSNFPSLYPGRTTWQSLLCTYKWFF